MINQEQIVEIKVMARQGYSIRQMARVSGLSRQTVRRSLLQPDAQAPRYPQRPTRPSVLDPFKPYIAQRIEQAQPDRILGSVLLREIREQGYPGGRSILHTWLHANRPAAAADPLVRFETAPGEQMQADFTWIRRRGAALLALVATLGYSRASYVRFSASEDTAHLIEGLRLAFEYFGGVPRHVLFDNAKSVMVQRDAYGIGRHRFNAQLLDFAQSFGFAPRVCRPYRAKTKGKVERFNGYLKSNFIVPLRATLHSTGLQLDPLLCNAHVGRWLDEVANARIHGTTGQVPAERLVHERQHLLPLPLEARWRLPATLSAPVPNAAPLAIRWALPATPAQHHLGVYEELLVQEVAR